MKNIMELQNGSDIRGISIEGVQGEEVNLDRVRAGVIGAAFAQWLAFKVGKNTFNLKVCVGHDPRLSAKDMSEGIMNGIYYMGAQCSDAGLASTPAMFMSTVMDYYEYDGAVMVTASHLPYNRNGFKFFTKDGGLNKEDIKQILTIASKIAFVIDYHECDQVNLMEMYAATLRQMISYGAGTLDGMKIVVDAGNGAGGFFATEVLEKMGADVSASQFLEPDGTFPNHQPNPENKEAMDCICKRVKESGADLGLIFDTDVDRSAAVAPGGRPIARNEIIALAAALGAEDYPGGTVVTDSITSKELNTFLTEKLGLRHLRYKRGYNNVINKAKALSAEGENAFLAIETSGHAAFADNYYLDDGAFLAVQIVCAAAKLKKEGKTIDALLEGLEAPAEAKEFRLNITDEDYVSLGSKILENLESWAEETDGLSLETINYEGVRVNFNLEGYEGWFLLRKSLHDPVLPLNVESKTEGGIDKAIALLKVFMNGYEGIDRL